jgi:hypothetical protein
MPRDKFLHTLFCKKFFINLYCFWILFILYMLVAQCSICYGRKITPRLACFSWLRAIPQVAQADSGSWDWWRVEHSSLRCIPFLCVSGRVNCVPPCPVQLQVQVAFSCGRDMYRLASCEVQTHVHNKHSAEGTTKHYLQVYLTVQQLQELCRHFQGLLLTNSSWWTFKQREQVRASCKGRQFVFLIFISFHGGHSSSSVLTGRHGTQDACWCRS